MDEPTRQPHHWNPQQDALERLASQLLAKTRSSHSATAQSLPLLFAIGGATLLLGVASVLWNSIPHRELQTFPAVVGLLVIGYAFYRRERVQRDQKQMVELDKLADKAKVG